MSEVVIKTENKRQKTGKMSVGTSTNNTSNRNAYGDYVDGAMEVGQGHLVTVPRAVPHAYNNNYTVRLTYADNYNLAVQQGTNSFQYQIFQTNSIYDPDNTNAGHQPYFRDMWASQYDYYAVLACDYKITFYNNAGQDPVTYTAVGTSGQVLGAVNISWLPTTLLSDITSGGGRYIYPMAEMKNSRTMLLIPGEKEVISRTLTPGDFIVDAKDSDSDSTWTAVGSNPSVGRYLGFNITGALQSAPAGISESAFSNITVQVILDYTVQFTQINPSIRQVPS